MVYMAADNSLSEECVFSLKEMHRIGTADAVDVIAQFHSSAKGARPRRYRIGRLTQTADPKNTNRRDAINANFSIGDQDGKLESIKENVSVPQKSLRRLAEKRAAANAILQSFTDGEYTEDAAVQSSTDAMTEEKLLRASKVTEEELLSASNPDVLEEFLQSNIDVTSAKKVNQLVILSGHGDGAVGPFLRSDNPSASLSVSALREVFENIRKPLPRNIDIVLMDSCLMSTAEVARQLYGAADLMIGAEGFELSTGWPYHRILETLNGAGTNSRKLALDLVRKYVLYYSDYDVAGVSVDQAVCDLTQTPILVEAVKDLAAALTEEIKKETDIGEDAALKAVLLAHWQAQSYNAEQYVDLWDFCDQLIKVKTGVSERIGKACQYVKDVIKGKSVDGKPEETIPQFVLQSCFSGAAFQHSHGVSIYFPWATDTQNVAQFKKLVEYKELEFHKETLWGDFLEEYLLASRREIRNLKEHKRKGEPPRCFIPTDGTRVGLRTADPFDKGGSGTTVGMKNPPVEFFREPCQ